ncbi:MAG: hypothetical protein PsegKO_21870 [Pseudohongiellaceae bacterium]
MSIRSLRQHQGLSQEQLAEQAGVSLRTIQRTESGQRVGNASLRTLAAFFGVSVDTLKQRDQHLLQMIMASAETARDPVTRHRALQLILFMVVFFVTVFQWLGYRAYLDPGPGDVSLWYILGYLARIAVAATILTCLFSFARVTLVRSYYVAVAVFALGAVVLTQVTASSVESASYPLVFPVYYSLMLLVMISIHTLQLALSLRGETALLIQR